jgi:hypothetical protein
LKDLPGRGVKRVITDEAKSWVLNIACIQPKDFGYAQETWTYSLMIKHIRSVCESAGYECFRKIDKGALNVILSKADVKPHKVSYYLERRDLNFDPSGL